MVLRALGDFGSMISHFGANKNIKEQIIAIQVTGNKLNSCTFCVLLIVELIQYRSVLDSQSAIEPPKTSEKTNQLMKLEMLVEEASGI